MFYIFSRLYQTCLSMALSFFPLFLLLCVKTATQALLPLHSIPVRSYIKAEGTKILIAINIFGPPCTDWAANEGGWKERSLRGTTDCFYWGYTKRLRHIAISCVWRHRRRSCCCCSWSGPSLCISLVASSCSL